LYPPMSSHRSLTPEQRAAIGIGDGLIRLSVGIEAVDDIIADLDQALGKVGSKQRAAAGKQRGALTAKTPRTPRNAEKEIPFLFVPLGVLAGALWAVLAVLESALLEGV